MVHSTTIIPVTSISVDSMTNFATQLVLVTIDNKTMPMPTPVISFYVFKYIFPLGTSVFVFGPSFTGLLRIVMIS